MSQDRRRIRSYISIYEISITLL